MNNKIIWLLRAITNYSLIISAWYFILSLVGWPAVATEWEIVVEKVDEQGEQPEEVIEYVYPLGDGKFFWGTSAEYAQWLREQKGVVDGEAERAEDKV